MGWNLAAGVSFGTRTLTRRTASDKILESRTKICGALTGTPTGPAWNMIPHPFAELWRSLTCLLMEGTGSTWLLASRVLSS